MTAHVPTTSAASGDDLIPDRALRESDDDAFNHDAIAANLAVHVVTAETPLNIALYGPWGSGKSSAFELLRRRLEEKPVRLVHYDASRYGGESLRRNFISHAAAELEFRDPQKFRRFHDGLYEGRKSAAVRMPESLDDWKKMGAPLFTLAVTLAGLLAVVATVGLGISYLTARDAPNQIAALLAGLAVPVGVVSILVAAGKAVLDGATITTEESLPSADEQFRRRFDELIEAARKKHRVERIVFFIDELDRCTPADVVRTLISVKTFLDHRECVFVVAADRDVLERALSTDLEQATPENEDHPYYSSASSFLDKVFHHQMFLPPLRKTKLTHFARDLVKQRGGVWKELRDAGGQRYLDRIVYALVPSHVVSPRRVKVLLNNFATNLRIIESRGIDLTDRAPEVARLTVLQTEFPSLAADLPEEPRLPELLLDPPDHPSPRVARMLQRHLVTLDSHGDPEPPSEAGGELPEVDPLLSSDQDLGLTEPSRRVLSVQNRDLYRYLRRTAGVGIVGPGRDLLYLEGAGSDHGLEDSALSEMVERDSLEAPGNILAELAARPDDERLAVVGLLCDMTEGEFGDERANVMSTLMGTVEMLGSGVQPSAARVVDAVRAFQAEQELEGSHLIGALQVGLLLGQDEGHTLAREVVADPRTSQVPERLRRAASLIDDMPNDLVSTVADALAEQLPEHPDCLVEALTDVSAQGVLKVLERERTLTAVSDRYASFAADGEDDEAAAFIEALYAVAGQHGDAGLPISAVLQWQLLKMGSAYETVRSHASSVMGSLPTEACDSHALFGLQRGGTEDWPFWRQYLSGLESQLAWRSGVVRQVLIAVIGDAASTEAEATAVALASYVATIEQSDAETVAAALNTALGARSWWEDEDALVAQRQVHGVARSLAPDPESPLGRAVLAALVADLRRVAEVPTARPVVPQPPQPLRTVLGLAGLRQLGASLPLDEGDRLIEEVVAAVPTGSAAVDVEAVRTIVSLAAAGARRDRPVKFDSAALIAALPYGPRGVSIVRDWLALDPSAETIVQLAVKVRGLHDVALRQSVSDWASRHSERQRTALVDLFLDEAPNLNTWVREIARHGVDDDALVEKVTQAALEAPRHEKRSVLIDFLLAVQPSTRTAHVKVAKLTLALLERGTKVDFDLALRSANALGTDHQHQQKLRDAFDSAAQRKGFRIPAKSLATLQAAGIRPKQRSLAESAMDLWASLFGGGGGRD